MLYAAIRAEEVTQQYRPDFVKLEVYREEVGKKIDLAFQQPELLKESGIKRFKTQLDIYLKILAYQNILLNKMQSAKKNALEKFVNERWISRFSGIKKTFMIPYQIGAHKSMELFHKLLGAEYEEVRYLLRMTDLFQKNLGQVKYHNKKYVFQDQAANKQYHTLVGTVIEFSQIKKKLQVSMRKNMKKILRTQNKFVNELSS